jgi:hypothetical protein
MDEEKKAEQSQQLDPEAFMKSLEEGLEPIIADEELRKKTVEWARSRMGELITVVIQQSVAIKQLSLVLDDVLSQLRRWAWSADKGWMRARATLNGVLDSFKRRAGHGGDGSQKSTGTGSESDKVPDASDSAASGVEPRGEA